MVYHKKMLAWGLGEKKGFLTMIYCEQEFEGDFYGKHLRKVI